MTQEAELAMWAKRESNRISQDWPLGSRAERELILHWRRNRPQMVARLQSQEALAPLAHVLHHKMVESLHQNRAAGMPEPDAREQAVKDWLMMEPEEDEPPISPSQSAYARIISSQIPSS